MKSIIFVFLSLLTTSSFAAPLEAIDCKKEMIQDVFADVIDSATMEELNINNYSFGGLTYAQEPYDKKYEYQVTIISQSRAQGSTPTYTVYGVKVVNSNGCDLDIGPIKE